MKKFYVSYDLKNSGREDYNEISEALKGLGAKKILETTWLIDLENHWTAEALKNEMLEYIDSEKDKLYVAQIKEHAHHNLKKNKSGT